MHIWLWQAQALGPWESILLNPDGSVSMRPLALMPQPATQDVKSRQQVWATRPVHRVSVLLQRLKSSADRVSIETRTGYIDTDIQIDS